MSSEGKTVQNKRTCLRVTKIETELIIHKESQKMHFGDILDVNMTSLSFPCY